jgi:hypothetical protein
MADSIVNGSVEEHRNVLLDNRAVARGAGAPYARDPSGGVDRGVEPAPLPETADLDLCRRGELSGAGRGKGKIFARIRAENQAVHRAQPAGLRKERELGGLERHERGHAVPHLLFCHCAYELRNRNGNKKACDAQYDHQLNERYPLSGPHTANLLLMSVKY